MLIVIEIVFYESMCSMWFKYVFVLNPQSPFRNPKSITFAQTILTMTNLSEKRKTFGRQLGSYFFQGLLILGPAFFTLWAIYKIFDLFDSNTQPLFQRFFHFSFPGIGIIVFVGFITLIGFLGSTIIIKPLMELIEDLLEHTPLVKDIYSSFKDFISAFISNKKKFNRPVLMEMGKGLGVYRMGFITHDDLEEFDIMDKVSVYCPDSYGFTGNLYIANRELVQPLPHVGSAHAMKYILSGGVMEAPDDKHEHKPEAVKGREVL
ncbi:MAG: hypothetical protein JWO03_671 [Bacteroidetes bacterium]|nr:hypothetical protein [Bacteroidota bacterium]